MRTTQGQTHPSIEPEKLLQAMLQQVLYSIRSERQLMKPAQYNPLYRRIIGLPMDDSVWVPTAFAKNRNSPIVNTMITHTDGHTECEVAKAMITDTPHAPP